MWFQLNTHRSRVERPPIAQHNAAPVATPPDVQLQAALDVAADLERRVRVKAPATAPAKLESPDDLAMGVLRGAVIEKDAAAREEIVAWVKAIELRCKKNEPFTVLEHTAMTYLLSSGFFAEPPANAAEKTTLHQDVRRALTTALTVSWKQLTGKTKREDELLTRLPKSVLRVADRRARLYHSAAFLPIGDRKAQQKASSLFRDYVPEAKDVFVLTAAVLAGTFSSIACEVLASAVLSYAVIGLSESVQHNHLAHPHRGNFGGWVIHGPRKGASWIERGVQKVIARVLKKTLQATHRSHHIVHHGLTYISYTQMFQGPEQKARVDAFLAKLDDKEAEKIVREKYGSTLDSGGLIRIMGSIAPQMAALITAGIVFGASPWAYIPLILTAAVYPFTMKQIHPFLHNDEHVSRESAGPVMSAILNSRWAAWACRNHWLHHNAPGNYNLSFPGADALMGTLLQPNLQDLLKMADEGTLHY